MNVFRIILQMHVFRNASGWSGRINGGTIGSDDKANLSRGISRNRCVGISDRRKYFFALVEYICDEIQMQPHALSLRAYHTLGPKGVLHGEEELWFEQRLSGSCVTVARNTISN